MVERVVGFLIGAWLCVLHNREQRVKACLGFVKQNAIIMKSFVQFGKMVVVALFAVGFFVMAPEGVVAATCSFSPNAVPSDKNTVVDFVWSGLDAKEEYSLLCGTSSEVLWTIFNVPGSSQKITLSGTSYSVGQHSCFLERKRDGETACTAAFTVTSSGSTNTCTSNCGTGGTCACVKDTSCVSPNTTVSAGSAYCASQLTDGVCCKTTSTSTTTCTGGTCRSACPSGEFSDSTCASSSCTSSSGSLYCRSCSGTSHSCVGASESCPSGTTATPACDNNTAACSTTSKQKYCVTSSAIGGGNGSGTSGAKCDTTKFEEYAGVCFPIGTGLSKTSVADIILNLMKWMLYLFGFLAIIAFVISGIQYLSAAGNMNMIETAKRNMNYSIIGIVVALSGLVILIAIDALLRGTGWGG